MNLGANLLVAYDPLPLAGGMPIAGVGRGVVAEFTTAGKFIGTVAWRGPLDDPWGMVMAPAQFGRFSNDLLVGNFGDGKSRVPSAPRRTIYFRWRNTRRGPQAPLEWLSMGALVRQRRKRCGPEYPLHHHGRS